jgi:hypothetical protein
MRERDKSIYYRNIYDTTTIFTRTNKTHNSLSLSLIIIVTVMHCLYIEQIYHNNKHEQNQLRERART